MNWIEINLRLPKTSPKKFRFTLNKNKVENIQYYNDIFSSWEKYQKTEVARIAIDKLILIGKIKV